MGYDHFKQKNNIGKERAKFLFSDWIVFLFYCERMLSDEQKQSRPLDVCIIIAVLRRKCNGSANFFHFGNRCAA